MRANVGVLLAGSVVALVTACGVDVPTAEPTATPSSAAGYRLEPACPPTGHIPPTSAALVNSLVAHADLPAWRAADIGASTRLGDGRLVWVFGDTVRSEGFHPRLVANSMLINSGPCISQLRAPDDGPVIPDVSADVVHWPMSVVRLAAPEGAPDGIEELLVVLSGRIRRDGTEEFLDFTYLGSSANVFGLPVGGTPQLLGQLEITPDSTERDQVNWGAAATIHKGWIYVYGTRTVPEELVFGRELYVGRAPVDHPADRTLWEFWDGSAWQSEEDRAMRILPAQGGVSQTLSVDYTQGRFVAVSKRDGDLGNFVYTWSAPRATGPWIPRFGSRHRPGWTPVSSSTPRWPIPRCRCCLATCWSRSRATPPTRGGCSTIRGSGCRTSSRCPWPQGHP